MPPRKTTAEEAPRWVMVQVSAADLRQLRKMATADPTRITLATGYQRGLHADEVAARLLAGALEGVR